MIEPVNVLWDFGNGQTSTLLNPTMPFNPGTYTVKLTVWDDAGGVSVIQKTMYIGVTSTLDVLTSPQYAQDPKIYHYGWKEEHGFGWSMNDGYFPLPATSASVCDYEEDGIHYTLVYDLLTGLEYVINTRNDYANDAVYKDKADINGVGGYSIETEIITSEMTAEMKRYDISHLETNLTFRPDLLQDDFTTGQSVAVSLIADATTIPVETQYAVDTAREISFYYDNIQTESSSTRSIRFVTAESNYQLLDYESHFKTVDRYKRAGTGMINESMEFFGSPSNWFTRGNYEIDRATGLENSSTFTYIAGLDGNDGTAINSSSYNVGNIDVEAICFWARSFVPPFGSTCTVFGVVDGWSLYYRNGSIADNILLNGDLFDIRTFASVILEEHLQEYFDKFKLYLPRW